MAIGRFGQSRRSQRFGAPPVGADLLEVGDSLALEETVEAELGTLSGYDARQIVLQRFYLDPQTLHLSNIPVRHPVDFYDARILSNGVINRSAALPPDLPQTSSAKAEAADTDQFLRGLFAQKTARRRRVETRVGVEGQSTLGFQTVYTGEIQKNAFPPGSVITEYLDTFFAWMDESIPNLITPSSFPNLPVGTQKAVFPLVYGQNRSDAFGAQGAMAPPYVDTVGFRYAVSRGGPMLAITAVYRKATSDAVYSLVDPAEYFQSEEIITVDGIDYQCTFLQFYADQMGADIRCDVDGPYGLPAFGLLPANRDGGLARNAVDFGIGMLQLTERKHKLPGGYDYPSMARAWQVCDTNSLYCDGIIDEQMTNGAAFGRWSSSTGITIYQNRFGKIAFAIPGDEDADPPELDDVRYLYRESVNQDFLSRTFNQIQYSYGRLYGWAGNAQHDSQWGAQDTFDNSDDQIALGGDGPPIVEDDTREMWFCRVKATAEWVIAQMLRYFGLETIVVTGVIPLPPNISRLELTKEVRLSHYGGVKSGGFVRERCQVQSLAHDLDKLETTFVAIRRAPVPSFDVVEEMTIADDAESTLPAAPTCQDDFDRADGLISVGHPGWSSSWLGGMPSILGGAVRMSGSSMGAYCDESNSTAAERSVQITFKKIYTPSRSFVFFEGWFGLCCTGEITALGHGWHGYAVEYGQHFGIYTSGLRLLRVVAGTLFELGVVDGIFSLPVGGYPQVIDVNLDLKLTFKDNGPSNDLEVFVNGVSVLTFNDVDPDRPTEGKDGFGTLQMDSSSYYIEADNFISY